MPSSAAAGIGERQSAEILLTVTGYAFGYALQFTTGLDLILRAPDGAEVPAAG
jgi:hypothetical protein